MRATIERNKTTDDVCAVPCFNQTLVESIRSAFPPDATINATAARYSALSDPTRLKILLALTFGELCVCDISHVLGLSMSATSHQLRLLRTIGIVQARNDGRMVYYSLCTDQKIGELLSSLPTQGCQQEGCGCHE